MSEIRPTPESASRTSRPQACAAPVSARQSSLRTANLALLAGHVFAQPEPVSRADVAAATGMTRSTASRLADDLVSAGILSELEPSPASGPGRPAVPLAPARGTFVAIGLEVNVSRMAVRAIDLSGQVLAERVVLDDFEASDPAQVLPRLAELATEALALDTVRHARKVGAAIALPGLVSHETLLRAPNLGWERIDPRPFLAEALQPDGLVLHLGNEANFGALTAGRSRPAAPHSAPSYIYLSGENGIGAGIVREGQVMLGVSGFAGEIGHIQADPTGPLCTCGNRGCVERYAGRQLILAAAGLEPTAGPDQLVAAWEAGEPQARRAVTRAAQALGVGLGAAINILDIPTVILGGHLAPLSEILRPELEAELRQRVLSSRWSVPEVITTSQDQTPAVTGAAWSLLEEVVADPAAWM
ncbi:ROK family transcriptional regulator [Actinomyces ruminicola]|uniref:Sugar kinase of the NBD/HSP70 family, may contain an N-terminal HTH domain n=1 Tax=Actinomyces ruminicola TaxID=332524 RepID=A0A1G9ZZS2_9ACTO|nr:ROK family transcriptional regulator [Actinomyces ruminicola]SDN26820.1 Sugar kinase of the NBD/HSP70 family, may contain an N-terminal HTH domain [Actinomyces ruminicola]